MAISLVAKIAASLRSSLLTQGFAISLGTLFNPALPNAIVVRQTVYSFAGLITRQAHTP